MSTMQITETISEGLRRGYRLTIPAGAIAARIDGELARIAPQTRLPGFRPGKVPANLLRKMHGVRLHQEALNTAIRESVDALVADAQLRPAIQPTINLAEGYTPGGDAEVSVELEVLPAIAPPDLGGLKLERLVALVSEDDIDAQISRLATSAARFTEAPTGHAAANGDQLILDFIGRIDGEAFAGGAGEDVPLVLGGDNFVPGFADQLIGAHEGEARAVTITFPEDYPEAHLKGRVAVFSVTVKAVKTPVETAIDDDFAKNLGLADLATLRDAVRRQIERDNASLTRTWMKRQLLDSLAEAHDFEVPPSMVEAEFTQIWRQLEEEAGREPDPEAARAEIEAERAEYHGIAVRRVRLGLLLSEIGQRHGVEISQQEMNGLIQQAAQRYRPEDRQRFTDYIRSDAMAAAQLRAPLYEEKVVDFLFSKAEVSERTVPRAEIEALIEQVAGEDGHDHGHDHGAAGHVHGSDCDHAHDHDHHHDHAHSEPAPASIKASKPATAKAAKATVPEAAAEAPAPKAAPKAAPRKKAASKAEAEAPSPAENAAAGNDSAEAQPEAEPKPRRKATTKAAAKTSAETA